MNKRNPPRHNANVLLIDDDEEFLELLSERLETRGMRVITALSGQEALGMVQRLEFDIIVIDLSMPGMNGIETLKKIKKLHPHTETIMLTGHASLQSGIEAMKSGAEDYLEKPADIEMLTQKINEAQCRRIKKLEKSSRDSLKKILKSRGW